MRAIVLGSAAGGGVPQWNCRCRVCSLVWSGDPRVKARSQSSLAILGADPDAWLVVNASPDIRSQIEMTPELHPRGKGRCSPIAAVLLTNGDIDHIAGLLSLREAQPFRLFATAEVFAILARNQVFEVLSAVVERLPLPLLDDAEVLPSLVARLFPVPGKVPLWLEGDDMRLGLLGEATIGVRLQAGGRSLAYVPGCAEVTDEVLRHVEGVDALLFDGTVLDDDELLREGVGVKTGRRMGHVPIRGPGGSIEALAGTRVGRRIFVHMNNTNPVLIEDSPERAFVQAAGWTVSWDGMAIKP